MKKRSTINRLQKALGAKFEMENYGNPKQFFGVERDWSNPSEVLPSHRNLTQKLLRQNSMEDDKPVSCLLDPDVELHERTIKVSKLEAQSHRSNVGMF